MLRGEPPLFTTKDASTLVDTCYGGHGDSSAHDALAMLQTRPEAWGIATDFLTLPQYTSVALKFFGATTLYAKLGTEWVNLSAEDRVKLFHCIKDLLDGYRVAAGFEVVASRLCLAFARIGVQGIASDWPNFVNDVMASYAGDVGVLVDVLHALPQEMDAVVMSEHRREKTCQVLRQYVSRIHEMAHHLVQSAGGASTSYRGKLHGCIAAWSAIAPRSVLTQGPLMDGLFSIAHGGGVVALEALATLSTILSTSVEDDGVAMLVVERILSLSGVFHHASGAGEDGHEVCVRIARLACAFAYNNGDIIARGQEWAKHLVSFILACTQHKAIAVSMETLHFWAVLQTCLLQNPKGLPLLSPHYGAVLEVLLVRCVVPTSIHQAGVLASITHARIPGPALMVDVCDEVLQCMEYRACAVETFQAIHRVRLDEYIAGMTSIAHPMVVRGEGDVGLLEAVLYAIHCVAHTLSRTLHRTAGKHPDGLALKQLIQACLNIQESLPPVVLIALYRLVEALSRWFIQQEASLSSQMGMSLAHALVQSPQTALPSVAADALRALGDASARNTACLPLLPPLLSSWTESNGLCALHIRDRQVALNAMVQMAMALDAEELHTPYQSMVSPVMTELHAVAHTDLSTVHASGHLSSYVQATIGVLQLTQSAIRPFHNGPYAPPHPCTPMLHVCWPLLRNILVQCANIPEVVKEACDVFQCAFLGLGSSMETSLAESSIPLLVECFTVCKSSPPLLALVAAVQAFSAIHELGKQWVDVLGVCLSVLDTIDAGGGAPCGAGAAGAVCEVALATMRHYPAILLGHPEIPLRVCAAVIPIINGGEKEHVRSALSFLMELLSPHKTVEAQENAARIVQGCGQPILQALIEALSSPTLCTLVHHFSDVLHALVHTYHNEVMSEWVHACFTSISSPFLSDQDKQRVAALAWTMDNKRRFKAMMADLTHILNAEMESDALAAYEVD